MGVFSSSSKRSSSSPKFSDVVRRRRATRKFLPKVIEKDQIRELLEEAQLAPSNCNTQPWKVCIVTGGARDRLSRALLAAEFSGKTSPDFYFNESKFKGVLYERAFKTGQRIYGAQGIKREDVNKRREFVLGNFEFYGAPHVALLFMPRKHAEDGEGAEVRTAADLGMYGQTFLLSLVAHGYAGLPQALLSLYADTVRETLGVSDDYKLLFGISFGYPDLREKGAQVEVGRATVDECVSFYS